MFLQNFIYQNSGSNVRVQFVVCSPFRFFHILGDIRRGGIDFLFLRQNLESLWKITYNDSRFNVSEFVVVKRRSSTRALFSRTASDRQFLFFIFFFSINDRNCSFKMPPIFLAKSVKDFNFFLKAPRRVPSPRKNARTVSSCFSFWKHANVLEIFLLFFHRKWAKELDFYN